MSHPSPKARGGGCEGRWVRGALTDGPWRATLNQPVSESSTWRLRTSLRNRSACGDALRGLSFSRPARRRSGGSLRARHPLPRSGEPLNVPAHSWARCGAGGWAAEPFGSPSRSAALA